MLAPTRTQIGKKIRNKTFMHINKKTKGDLPVKWMFRVPVSNDSIVNTIHVISQSLRDYYLIMPSQSGAVLKKCIPMKF